MTQYIKKKLNYNKVGILFYKLIRIYPPDTSESYIHTSRIVFKWRTIGKFIYQMFASKSFCFTEMIICAF